MNEEYRLQLLSHGEVFSTREEAIEYINDNFKGEAYWSEPALFFYGDTRNPKMIVAVGASKDPRKPRVCIIDDAELREMIAAVEELAEKNAEDIQTTSECLLETINAVGLTVDDNKIKDKVTYEPDPNDVLIRNAETVAEAIAIISTFVQEKVKDLSTAFEDTKSIDFTTMPLEEGSIVKADVKISTEGEDDDLDFNNNIIGVRNDGLFASCGLEYDADHNRLIFTSSGVKNGHFSPDAIKKIIDLGEHTIYTTDNEGHNIELNINQERGTISADAKISQNQDNILSVTDGKLFVEGRAKNIKFQNTNVATKLVEITKAIDEIKDKISVLVLDDLVIGDESDSIITRAIKNPNGGYTITADTRFGSDKSIVIANGGLSANIDVQVDSTANKLTLKVGNVDKVVTLPGVSIIDNIVYDSANKAIIITWKDGSQKTVIPVGDMLSTWDVYNNPSSAVTLTKSAPATPTSPELLSAEVKVRTTDNLLGKNSNGELYVNKSDIDDAITNVQDAVTAETSARITADGELSASIAEANAQVNLVKTNLSAEINRAQAAEGVIEAKVSTLETRTEGLSSELTAETLARTTADAVHDEKITTLQNDLAAAESTHNADITRLQGSITENSNAIAVLNGPASQTGSVLEAIEIAKTASNAYTDTTVAHYKHLSDDYTDEAKRQAISEASTNADAKVAVETARAQAAEEANANEIMALKAKDVEIDEELAKKIESVTVEQSTASNRQYIIKVDGVDAGEINIPEDKFIREVHYDAGNKAIVFTFVTETGETTFSVSVADLVDTYTAGNGLRLDGNKFSVVLNEDTESYLSLTPEGLKVMGIDAALADKANATDVYTKDEADVKFITEHQDISYLATKEEVNAVSTKADANEAAITIINGNEAQEGSIKKALTDAKAYANNIVASEAQSRITADNLINETLATKANAENVYTKSEIDAKNYLQPNDIATLADKSEVTTEVSRAQTAEAALAASISETNANVASNTANIADMKREERRLNLIVDETNSVKLVKSKDDDGTELSADVKLDTSSTNILKITGNGLTADVEMTYSQATNTITFSNGITTREMVLAGASLVEDGYYNSVTKQIILITRLSDGTTREIAIDASALIHSLKVQNSPNNPVKLYKTVDSEGVDVLSASVDISNESNNLILNNNGTLYASNEAKNHTALWEGNEMSLQAVLEVLKTKAEKGAEAAEEVNEIKDDLHRVEVELVSMQATVGSIDRRVADNTTAIAQQAGAISTLSGQVSDLNSHVSEMTTQFTKLKNEVETYDGRLSNLEDDNLIIKGQISTIDRKLGNISEDNPVSQRLTTLESEISQVDNGTY